jgi:hypothetical protein
MKLIATVLVILLFTVNGYGQKERTFSDSLLLCLVGHWQGKGTSFGNAVEDKISFDTTIKAKFLFMKLSALKGDDFVAEGYLWYNPNKACIEFYEFNDGAWPVRILSGKAQENNITLEENIDGRHIRITFLISKDSFVLTETRISNGKESVFVNETFRRVH